MLNDVVILSCELRQGNAKKTGNPYKFYSGTLLSELGEMKFTSDEEFKVGINLKAKSLKMESVLLTLAGAEAKIKRA